MIAATWIEWIQVYSLQYFKCTTVYALKRADLNFKLCISKYIYIVLSVLKLTGFVTE